MAVIDEIKQRILQLDAGSFQSMCDRYLSKIGYPNIVSLGTQAGTQKTTRGTPDTYFFDANGKYVFDSLIASAKYAVYDVSDFIESIVTPKQNDDRLTQKQDQWIRHFIAEYSADTDKMKYLFYGIANLPSKRKVDYIKLLLDHNQSFEMLESLPLFPLVTSWSNSAVPYLTSRIKYMEQILPNLPGLKFIKHKRHIEGIIDGLREQIRQEEIHDILNS